MAHNLRLKNAYYVRNLYNISNENLGKLGQNGITARGFFPYMENPNVTPSKTTNEAQMKSRRLYKRICRLVG